MSQGGGRAPKGIDRGQVVAAAFALLGDVGEAAFSIRKLAARLSIDPMTVLHHVGSRDALLRQVADAMTSEIRLTPAQLAGDWRARLQAVAHAFRGLAHRYPKVYPLLVRFHATGPADHQLGEVVYAAMREAGLSERQSAELGLGLYSLVIGFALSEVEGMVRATTPEETMEMRDLPPEDFPVTRALIPAFATLSTDATFDATLGAYLDGVAIAGREGP